MWDLIHCYLSGRHDYGMWCETGQMFLRCVHCGKRSSGWAVEAKFQRPAPRPAVISRVAIVPRPGIVARAAIASPTVVSAKVIPFDRAAAS
jgi:hypothetical protein